LPGFGFHMKRVAFSAPLHQCAPCCQRDRRSICATFRASVCRSCWFCRAYRVQRGKATGATNRHEHRRGQVLLDMMGSFQINAAVACRPRDFCTAGSIEKTATPCLGGAVQMAPRHHRHSRSTQRLFAPHHLPMCRSARNSHVRLPTNALSQHSLAPGRSMQIGEVERNQIYLCADRRA
jgi:hypothetical protein